MSNEEFDVEGKSQDELEARLDHELSTRGLTRGQVVKGGMAFAAAIGLGTLFAACGGDDDQAAPAPPEEAPAPPEEAPPPPPPPEEAVAPRQVNLDLEDQVYYMMAANQQDPFYNSHREAMADVADIYGVRVEMAGPVESDFSALGQAFQEVLSLPDTAGLFAYTGDINIMQPFYDEAFEKGIPIVDGAVGWGEPRVAFIGPPADNQVPLAGDLLAEQVGGAGTVASFYGAIQFQVDRAEALDAYMAETYPDVAYAGFGTHDFDVATATQNATDFLQANPDIGALWWQDGLGGTVADVLKERFPDVKLVINDLVERNVAAIQAGTAEKAIGVSTYDEGFYGFQYAIYWWNGWRAPKDTFLADVVLDASNADAFAATPNRRA
jgi:ribose transport system substrate-binding protein